MVSVRLMKRRNLLLFEVTTPRGQYVNGVHPPRETLWLRKLGPTLPKRNYNSEVLPCTFNMNNHSAYFYKHYHLPISQKKKKKKKNRKVISAKVGVEINIHPLSPRLCFYEL